MVFSVSKSSPITLAMPKSMTTGAGDSVDFGNQDVRRLDVAVNDALQVRVLNCAADLDKEGKAADGYSRRAYRSTW